MKILEKVGVLVVAYGSRGAAIADSLTRSVKYDVDLYIADKQRNPLNVKAAREHRVIPDLSVEEVSRFAEKYKDSLDFGIVGPEGPIIAGIRDSIEERTGIPIICPTREYALEGSKVEQRILLEKAVPEVNPRFKVFSPTEFDEGERLYIEFKGWVEELGGVEMTVIKPDKPGYGKGVGVGGEHFDTLERAFEHFKSIYGGETGERVIVEEKVEGEESSFQAFCDGRKITPLPDTRDYKRAFDGDEGPNTGGMGSYKDVEDWLPFMEKDDLDKERLIAERIFDRLKGGGDNQGLRGLPFYIAFMHSSEGAKILEINSRPGDPEIMNILPVLKDDLVDLCFSMIEGNLGSIDFDRKATVVTYAVPLTYGGYRRAYSGDGRVDLEGVYSLFKSFGDNIRFYPGSLELRDGGYYTLKSRTVAIVGVGDSIKEAREISLEGVRGIDGPLWNRWEIASEGHIQKSIAHMKRLRKR